MAKFRENKKGFTLVELLIVVAIVGMLAAIAIPQFASSRMKAFNSAAVSDSRSFKSSMEGYFTDANSYPVSADGGETVSGASSPSIDIEFSTSADVTLWYESLAQDFITNAWHQSGSKQYGGDSYSPIIYVASGPGPLHGTLSDHIAANYIWPAPWEKL